MKAPAASRRVVVLLSCTLLNACGGGGGSQAAIAPIPPPTSGSVVIQPGSSVTSVAMPPVGGFTGSITVPTGSGGSILVAITSTGLPSLPAGSTPLLLFTYTANADSTIDTLPGLVFNTPPGSNPPFRVAAFVSGGWSTVEGPSTVSGNTYTIAPAGSGITLLAGHFFQLVLYSGNAL